MKALSSFDQMTALQALVVNLGTDHSPGDQVNFYLQTEIDISSGSTDGLAPFIKPEENVTSTGENDNSSTGFSQKLVSEPSSCLPLLLVCRHFSDFLNIARSLKLLALSLYCRTYIVQGNSIGASINFDKKSRVEVLSLERGEEKNLLVWFYAAGALDEAKAARLQRRTFRLSLKCAEKKGRSKLRFSNIIQVCIKGSCSCKLVLVV